MEIPKIDEFRHGLIKAPTLFLCDSLLDSPLEVDFALKVTCPQALVGLGPHYWFIAVRKVVGLCLLAWRVHGRAEVETVTSHPSGPQVRGREEGMGAVRALQLPSPMTDLG